MAVIDHIDGENRLIYLHSDTVNQSVHPIDVYKEMRVFRRVDESLRKYDVFLTAKGNEPKGGGKYTERYVVCNSGTRIVPYDATQALTITGTIITDDGQEGISCFSRSGLSNRVDINYVPPQVEVIQVSVGSGLNIEQDSWLHEVYRAHYNRRRWDKTGNTITVYADDGVTPMHVFDTNSDMSEVTPL